MAFVCRLTKDGEPDIDLFYSVTGWAMLEKGLMPNDPERRELWGGYLEDQLVRQEDGKREIPLKLQGEWASPDELIDAVNALEARLRDASHYRITGAGAEVFFEWQLHNATFPVRYPVLSGQIDKNELMNACGLMMDATGHREAKGLVSVGVTLVCENYWEATEVYTLENMCDNPGFWRGAAPGDSWTEVNGVDVLTSIDTGIYEVMGQSLKMVISPDAVNDTGVISDAQTVVAATNYYLEARVYSAPANDTFTVRAYDATGAAPIAASTLTFPAAAAGWVKLGVAFATPGACVSLRVEAYRLAANSSAGDKTYYLDAVYLTPGTDAPVGWSSGRNLMNHLDADADHLNVLCVTEIPGEVEAEVSYGLDLTQGWSAIYVAKRTRDDPHDFIWQLLPIDAVMDIADTTIVGGFPGIAPGGSRIETTFATSQAMVMRCHWDISANLAAYYGKYQFAVLASKSANTDVVKMQLEAYNDTSYWPQGGTITKEILQAGANEWGLYSGWECFSFPIGEHNNDLWDVGNRWQIRLYASITGGAAWDNLWIAGLYLIPIDEAYAIGGMTGGLFGAGVDAVLKQLDGDRGLMPRSTALNRYYNNTGCLGKIPLLTPEEENWLYFIVNENAVAIMDPVILSLTYRPRGIFLRGNNP